jgi:16S rRNA (guanine966-N2)-methyltransferase
VRVISGSAKGRRLRTTRAPEMRPTTDMVRQAIFDILGARVRDAIVLDLFSGAGSLGIEALSRGARAATFVDIDREACAIIDENLTSTRLREHATIRRADAARFLSGRPRIPFDLVFLDPPYDRGLAFVARTLGKLAAGDWVSQGGTVVVEAQEGQISWPPGFRETRIRKAGRTQVSLAVRDGERENGHLPGDI